MNEGAHQIRLYQQGPNGVDNLTESCLRDGHVRVVPCASLLLRIYRAPIGPQGRALEVSGLICLLVLEKLNFIVSYLAVSKMPVNKNVHNVLECTYCQLLKH